jgi:hypothetical protein
LNAIESPALPEAPSANCTSCGAELAPDQRYCLACGHPCSPVRLAFLDVLQSEHHSPGAPNTIMAAPVGYGSVYEPAGSEGWLRRYSALFGLAIVLLLAVLVGLLIGHWVSASKGPTKSVFEVKGLSGLAAPATAAAPAATTAAASTPTPKSSTESSATSKSSEAVESAKEKAETKAPPAAPVKATSNTLSKLSKETGKQHQQEINKLAEGGQPIETGGGK